jgi:hypothetical protein
VPEVKLVVVIMSCGIVIASDRVADFVWTGLDASVTLKVRLAVPTVVGVPEIMPVAGARLRPA